MQQKNNAQVNNSFEQTESVNQQTGTCPIFNQSPPQNPYYNIPVSGNQVMNNPYISSQNPLPNKSISASGSYMGDYVKGALIGAAVTYLLTNKKVQNAFFQTAAKTSSMFQMGMEEVKERFEDAKADVAAQNIEK